MNQLPVKKMSEEVFQATDDIVQFDKRAIEFIKQQAMLNTRGRARICMHKSSTDNLHEMFIAIRSDSYIRPHRHHNKSEAFHLIEGRADIVILNEEGDIHEIIRLGKEYCFYYRLSSSYYHTLIIHSPLLIIHEITNGPFNANESDFGKFSPSDTEKAAANLYIEMLKNKILSKRQLFD